MIWARYGGIIAGVVLMLVAVIAVLPPIVRTQRHAKAIVPDALIAKFEKAQDDVDRVQGATVLAEELVLRLREAVERIRVGVEALRSLLVVPRPNRD